MNYYELKELSEAEDTDSKLKAYCKRYCEMEDFFLQHLFIDGAKDGRDTKYFRKMRAYNRALMQYIDNCKRRDIVKHLLKTY